jgi:hypothetical protein
VLNQEFMAIVSARLSIHPPLGTENRSKVRFPLELPVRYRSLGRECTFAGTGRVVNISSGGVLVTCRQEIRAGSRLELNIEWPFLLDGRTPLQLVTLGRVLRSEASHFAAVLDRHQFQTARRTVVRISGSPGAARNQMAKNAATA